MKGFIEKIIPDNDYRKVYFDLPGMGKTTTAKQIYKAQEMYDIIKCFIKLAIGEEKYILAGESYGGYLSRKLIKDEPEKILGAMFLCPVIIPKAEERNLPPKALIYDNIADNEIRESEVYKNFMDTAAISDVEILNEFEKNIYSGIKNGNEEFLSKYYQHGYAFLENIDEIKEPFEKPALFIAGKQDHIVGYEDLEKILNNYPRSTVCLMDESGHNAQIEKPEICKILIMDWLERIGRRI